LVEHSLGKGEVISSILIIGSRFEAFVVGAMTGPWMFVRWAGVVVVTGYLALSAVAIWRLRHKSLRLPQGLVWPLIVGNFIAFVPPSLFFDDVGTARICFVAAQVVYLYGFFILIKSGEVWMDGSLRSWKAENRNLGFGGSNSVVESQPSKLLVAGSIPVSRSMLNCLR
jgi:prepilin signal peptidase PulO-like enzyme (type II secretory pathway)